MFSPLFVCLSVGRITQNVMAEFPRNQSLSQYQRHSENKSSAVAEMGKLLATIGMGRKVEAAVPLSAGSWVHI